jgi:putative transposase
MARQPRVVLPGVPLHVVQRGNDRVRIFHAEADLLRFREDLAASLQASGVSLHAYVFMPNHVHLLLTPPNAAAPAQLMRGLGARYVRYVNSTYGRTGTLWEGRYRSTMIDSDRYLLACIRYIERNPVRAGLVREPEDYPWSSFRFHALGTADPLVTPHPLYVALSHSPQARRVAHIAFSRHGLEPDELQAFRATIRGSHPRASARESTEFEHMRRNFPGENARTSRVIQLLQ